jgi:hypothetical protein
LTGKQTYTLFAKFDVLNYVIDCYGALHTTGSQYTIDDIDKFIESAKLGFERTTTIPNSHPPTQTKKMRKILK